MARVEYHRKALSVDPLKTSPALGGALAFLGLDRCIPLLHGSVGCANFAKVLLTRHFREPIPLASTALTDLGACMGGGETALEALRRVAAKGPAVIGLLSTALTETKGDDLAATVREFRAAFPEQAALPVIAAATPDFAGSLQEGYAAAVEAILREAARPGERKSALVNVLAGPAFTPADVDEVRAMVEAFGLTPLVVPDLSRSLDGHLDREPAPWSTGGTPWEDLADAGRAGATLVLGPSLETAAAHLSAACGVPYQVFPRLSGLGAVDEFLGHLAALSGRRVPDGLRRERRRLLDGMLDAHFFLGGRRAAVALEADQLVGVASLLTELGMRVAGVAATAGPGLDQVSVDRIRVGDLADLEELAAEADVLIAGSQAADLAERLGKPLLRWGFPVLDRLGAARRLNVGYAGTLDLLFEAANALAQRPVEPAAYRSPLRPQPEEVTA